MTNLVLLNRGRRRAGLSDGFSTTDHEQGLRLGEGGNVFQKAEADGGRPGVLWKWE